MINEKKFNETLKQYNEEMNTKMKENDLRNLSELKLRQVLTEGIVKSNKENDYKFNIEYIEQVVQGNDYKELHNELQKLFNEFIPFSTIRRFLNKVDKLEVINVCRQIEKWRDKGYSECMCYIK